MVRLLMAVITWNAEETSWCKKEFILWRKNSLFNNMRLVATQQILLTIISMKMPLIISERESDLQIPVLNLLDYGIWNTTKKILYKNVKRYEDIEGLSAAISYAWDKLTKKFINNSIEQLRMRLEKVVEGGSHIEHLIWRHWLMIPRTFL